MLCPVTHLRFTEEQEEFVSKRFVHALSDTNLERCLCAAELTGAEGKVLRYFIRLCNAVDVVRPSLATIAREVGYAKRTVQRAIDTLKQLEILKVLKCPYRTCLYKIAAQFKSKPFLHKIGWMFFSASSFTFSLLLSQAKALPENSNTNVHISYRINKDLYKQSSCEYAQACSQPSGKVMNSFNSPVKPSSEAHPRGWIIEKGEVMQDNPIRDDVRQVPLHLTKWGQMRLMMYSREVIFEASKRLLKVHDIKNPFEYFVAICDRLLKEYNIQPDLQSVSTLMVEYKAPANPTWIMRNDIKEDTIHGKIAPKKGPRGSLSQSATQTKRHTGYSAYDKSTVTLREIDYEEEQRKWDTTYKALAAPALKKLGINIEEFKPFNNPQQAVKQVFGDVSSINDHEDYER